MIQLYDNWYQLNDNGNWSKPERVQYNARGLRLLLLGGKARIMGDTVVMVNCASGYKLKLSDHDTHMQNDIIDTIIPLL